MRTLYPVRSLCTALIAVCSLTTAASAQISVRSPLSDDREVVAGSTYEGVIRLRNETDTPQEAKIYQTDYLFQSDGSNFYGEPGTTSRSNANWIRLPSSTIMLPPGELVPVTYSVQVPDSVDGEALSGSYWSMIMVESIPTDSPESTLAGDDENIHYGIRQVMRYGIQVATHAPSSLRGELTFTSTDLQLNEDGSTALQLDIENVGMKMVRPETWVEIYSEEGDALGRKDGVRNRIYPGTSVRQRYQLGDLPTGSYRALVIVDGGGDEVFGAEYNLVIE